MPNLGEYLGQLIAELARARALGDSESVRIADRFAGHTLLKGFSVPRFRMLNVELDIPVGIRDEVRRPPSPAVKEKKATKRVAGVLRGAIKRHALQLTAQAKSRLELALQKRAAVFEEAGLLPQSVTQAVDDMTGILRRELAASTTLDEPERATLEKEFAESVRRELLERQSQPLGVDVVVATAELRELASPDLLLRVRLTLTEEGMEWRQGESQGGGTMRLRPE